MDPGRQAGGALDAAVVPPLPGERGPVAAERARVQLGESVAAARPTDADRHVVADQPPATLRQDGWAAGQARPLLLAPAGGESPDAAAVRGDAQTDLGAARADRLTGGGCHGVRLGEERTQGGRAVREMSSGTRHRTDSSAPGGRHHGAITATEDVDRSAGSLAYGAADQ